jgi:molybdopterin molybdotransferase
MQGATGGHLDLKKSSARLKTKISNDGNRPHYLRGHLQDGVFTPIGRQESHALFGLSQSNALLRVPPDETLDVDALVTVETWD